MNESETKKISLDIPVDILERLDRLAKIADRPRAKIITNLLEASVETLEDCQKVGLLSFAVLVRDMKVNMSKWAQSMKDKIINLNDD